jgi:hypothetical protein
LRRHSGRLRSPAGSTGTGSGSISGGENTGACTGGAGCVVVGRTIFLPDCVAALAANAVMSKRERWNLLFIATYGTTITILSGNSVGEL